MPTTLHQREVYRDAIVCLALLFIDPRGARWLLPLGEAAKVLLGRERRLANNGSVLVPPALVTVTVTDFF